MITAADILTGRGQVRKLRKEMDVVVDECRQLNSRCETLELRLVEALADIIEIKRRGVLPEGLRPATGKPDVD